MDGLLLYWISWLMWIITTFLMPKHSLRTFLSVSLLMLIISTGINVPIVDVSVKASIIVLLLVSVIMLTRTNNWLLNTFKSLCIVFGYVGLLFWEQISPVWLFLPRTLMIPILGFIVLSFLSHSFLEKCAIWCLGVTAGEVLHGLILSSYGLNESIGDMAYLDLLFIEIGFLFIAKCFIEFKWWMDSIVQTIERQKKRWTHE